ncbi:MULTISPECIES: hypothetical protein [unclassified Massilia]|uniref:hypothetical protein n=1 Tax=unclassified Massilia TaxID=2609279 RepID=UPI0015FEF516|nr:MULTISPECIES: hypothetical protein [unclassified Massilia]
MKMRYSVFAGHVDVKAPLIYMWEIHDLLGQLIGRYIGKANGGDRRPTQHYPRNVDKLRQGLPYRKGKNYRRVHYALADAVKAEHAISLIYLCNVLDTVDIFKVESHYIEQYGCNADDGIGLNGRWKGAPREVVAAVPAVPVEAPASADPASPDLDDFLEYFDDKPRETFEVRVNTRSCSVWSAGRRILRAKQARPGARVLIKLVQSSTPEKPFQFVWDGDEEHIDAALDQERKLLLARGEAVSF